MNIQFRQGSETLSPKLIERAQVKIAKLSRFVPERTDEASVYVDIEKESGSRHAENLWRSSVHLDIAGNRFNAASTASNPDKATELAIKELKYEVRKAKGKRTSIARRGQEFIKRLRRSS